MNGFCSKHKDASRINKLATDAVHFTSAHGMLMLPKEQNDKACIHLPFTLFPSLLPKNAFNLVCEIQPYINKMMHLLSQDVDFLSDVIQSVIESDEFTRKMFEIYQHVQTVDTKSRFELGVFRADYMFNRTVKPTGGVESSAKQVEINTIASGLCGVCDVMTKMHSRIMKEDGLDDRAFSLPDNHVRNGVASGMVTAWKAYGNPDAVIVFLVMSYERNIYDQRALEYAIYSINDNIKVRRKTFDDVINEGRITDDGKLFISNEEVAYVYFRVGYSPDQYPTQQHWDARLIIEKSRAIKSPSIAHQLIGCKKMQEVLARPGVVERYIKDPTIAEKIRSTFVNFYSLDMNSSGDDAVKLALANPDDYVLKPQREGGGNNLYGEDILKRLAEIGNDERRCAYILMEKIKAPPSENITLSAGNINKAEIVNELGIFGVFLTEGKELVENYTAGHLLRSKSIEHNDGGLLAGVTVLDSPLLV